MASNPGEFDQKQYYRELNFYYQLYADQIEVADGLVIATPTGSTAYSLSVGGPIMVPHSNTVVITPVAPHSLNVRPIVIRDDWEITLDVESRSHNFLVAIDGRSETCKETTQLTIRRADYSVKVVKRFNHIFFDTLRSKMTCPFGPV